MRQDEWLRTLCITVLGSGFAPIASGTWGSLVAVALFFGPWLALTQSGFTLWQTDLILTLPGVAISCVLSVRWGVWAIAKFGRSDPKQFVLDEFAGQWVALLAVPAAAVATPSTLIVYFGSQFLLFRFFDIAKVAPARQIERWPAGWGVLCDDLVAGAYALIVGQLAWRLLPIGSWIPDVL